MDENSSKVIPLPKKKECVAILGEDNEVQGYIVKKRENLLGRNWVVMYQSAMVWLSQQDMTGEQYKVLMYLLGKLDWDNYLMLSRQDIAENTGLKPTAVSRAMKRLKELGIIMEGPKAGYYKTYRVNPYMMYRGGGKRRYENLIQWDKAKEAYEKKRQKEQEQE